jgi:WD40 repeat protein
MGKRKIKYGCTDTKRQKRRNEDLKNLYYPYHLAVLHSDYSVGIYKDGERVRNLVGQEVSSGRVFPCGVKQLSDGRIAVHDDIIRIWNLENDTCETLDGKSSIDELYELSDRRIVSWSTASGRFQIWNVDTKTFTEIGRENFQTFPTIRISNGEHTAICLPLDSKHVIAKINDRHLAPFELFNDTFVSQLFTRSIGIWNIRTRTVMELQGHTDRIMGYFVQNPSMVVTWSLDTTIRVWNTENGSSVVLKGHGNPVSKCIPWDENRVVSCSENIIRVWNIQDGKCTAVLEGHTARICQIVRLSDNSLASCSEDCTIRIWNIETGEYRIENELYTPFIHELSDGRLVLKGQTRDTYRIWNRENESLTTWHGCFIMEMYTKHDQSDWSYVLYKKVEILPRELWSIVVYYL